MVVETGRKEKKGKAIPLFECGGPLWRGEGENAQPVLHSRIVPVNNKPIIDLKRITPFAVFEQDRHTFLSPVNLQSERYMPRISVDAQVDSED